MKNRILTLTTLLLIFILAACGTSSTAVTEPPQTPPEPATATETVPTVTATAPVPTATSVPPTEETPATEEASNTTVSFANDVYPIFEERCIKCHGVETTKEGLDLLTYDNLLAGSRNGPVLVPGSAAESLLVKLIVEGEMPNRGPLLTAEQIQIITDWVNQGALNN
ncbi:hypothetical protein FBQ99_08430 [Chloroflexi bacterium CFX2]|nr:hypothetical protein [Chloroflexi bacterium CFX2]